ncbi:MAG: helix-turn-helix domain-containing protein [Lachnospiraceae bacterium]|nr:helix-turn-helix domain-containing protein [Lachnospiraceae bacterium]MDE6995664.1 helix-turn-helix domain-containing protein [Lachnospiraceae bacterium]
MDYPAYVRQRITELRLKRDVSEYEMSLALGMNRNYIQGITSGKALPSMAQFLNICEYFEITPMQFFDGETLYPQLIRKVIEEMQGMDDEDLLLLLTVSRHLRRKGGK